MLRIIMFGAPGSGKGTCASKISDKLGIPHISTGDLVRKEIESSTDIGDRIEDYNKRGELVPDKIVIRFLKKRVSQSDCANGFILDGFPRTIEQDKALQQVSPIDLVIQLKVPDDIILERLLNRLNCRKCGATYNERFLRPRAEGICDKCGGRLYKRHDDIPEVIKKRLDIYAKQTEPLLDRYKKRNLVETVSISNAETPQTVVDKIMAIIVARTVSRQPLWASVM